MSVSVALIQLPPSLQESGNQQITKSWSFRPLYHWSAEISERSNQMHRSTLKRSSTEYLLPDTRPHDMAVGNGSSGDPTQGILHNDTTRSAKTRSLGRNIYDGFRETIEEVACLLVSA